MSMREILFRGKRVDNGEWVESYYIPDGNKAYIGSFGMQFYEVDAFTVGQYTGLTDRNGKRIFEGDVLRLKDVYADVQWDAVVLFGNPHGRYTWGWELVPIGEPGGNTDILCWVEMEESGAFCKVIGNIHDNPELLERGWE